ncbi:MULTISPECIES: hypothetical protein [unclassified Polaribacter]|uniref:hypothetical protein n=1 Tax=unclassified Polaribacter TaxID=196858 RepID=UPI0011BFC5AB|nr:MULTISPECIES: hypothetical protein [unclassified Polaribacter]TXD51116.1 hypothetical protein ES043_13385 [Polaribacter sp. IC063]TXD58177.1 hypothetical protein ES044_12990 [Polaribacter sp. IC066]
MNDKNLKTLAWFNNDYYNIIQKEKAGTYRYVALRYPMLNYKDANTFVFKFMFFKKNKEWDLAPLDGNSPTKKDL